MAERPGSRRRVGHRPTLDTVAAQYGWMPPTEAVPESLPARAGRATT